MKNYRDVSLWFDQLATDALRVRPSLHESIDVDVVIIGAGYTGLWTAYYLKTHYPSMSVAIIESDTAGFGASGRNGGWLKGSLTGDDQYLSRLPADQRRVGYGLLHGIVDHVAQILEAEGIECGFHKGGVIFGAARYPEQLEAQQEKLAALRGYGHGDDDYRWLDASELESQIRMRQPYGAIFSPHCAVINPAKLVRGLADAVERKGVTIYERSPVSEFHQNQLRTLNGEVKAKIVVPALEGYSESLSHLKGYLLPVQSLIIATERLSDEQWDEIGLADRPAFSDGGRFVTYGQKSSDGRLIFGARGGYQFGARSRSSFTLQDPEFDIRKELLIDLLPALKDVAITHGWGGTLGMSRRFIPHVIFDPISGIGTAGGYGGGGVGASNLFGRTLADLILERDTDLVKMPWVTRGTTLKRFMRKWEPEPLPWLTYKMILSLYSWEENLYQSPTAPRWRKALAGTLSQAFSRLIS